MFSYVRLFVLAVCDDKKKKKKSLKLFCCGPQDDAKLKMLAHIFGAKNWSLVSKLIEDKSAKQCRERFELFDLFCTCLT